MTNDSDDKLTRGIWAAAAVLAGILAAQLHRRYSRPDPR